jgi:hypothetical protein
MTIYAGDVIRLFDESGYYRVVKAFQDTGRYLLSDNRVVSYRQIEALVYAL